MLNASYHLWENHSVLCCFLRQQSLNFPVFHNFFNFFLSVSLCSVPWGESFWQRPAANLLGRLVSILGSNRPAVAFLGQNFFFSFLLLHSPSDFFSFPRSISFSVLLTFGLILSFLLLSLQYSIQKILFPGHIIYYFAIFYFAIFYFAIMIDFSLYDIAGLILSKIFGWFFLCNRWSSQKWRWYDFSFFPWYNFLFHNKITQHSGYIFDWASFTSWHMWKKNQIRKFPLRLNKPPLLRSFFVSLNSQTEKWNDQLRRFSLRQREVYARKNGWSYRKTQNGLLGLS